MSITVLMTTYNCAPYIKQAIKSVLNQTYKAFEFLIIDDGSTDNTEEIVYEFNDSRIRYIKSTHIGRSSALNLGLKKAKYDLISFCDADDIIHPQKIEKQLILYKNENDLIFTNSAFFKNRKVLFELKIENDLSIIKQKIALHGHLGQSVLFNRNFIIQNGGYNINLNAFEDYDLLLRVMNKANIVILPEILYFQRLRKDSLSTTETMKKKHLIYEIQKTYLEDLTRHFDIILKTEQLLLKGWREFFYGSKSLCRSYWVEAGITHWNSNLIISFLLSYLPDNFLDFIKDKRLRLRLNYQRDHWIKNNTTQDNFIEILKLIDE